MKNCFVLYPLSLILINIAYQGLIAYPCQRKNCTDSMSKRPLKLVNDGDANWSSDW